ncbi:MAG: hypothetical protein ABIT76_14000 [Chthoniobacterales bacterium]
MKPALLGNALREACPDAEFHWANEGLLSSDKQRATAIDQIIGFWAIVNQSGGHIIHGREVMGFWQLFAGSSWITFLGNPLWRAMDSYRHILQDSKHPLHGEISGAQLSIGEFFASSISKPIRNRQSSKLLTISASQETEPAWLFEHARRRLEHFAWVGLEGIDMGPQLQLARTLRTGIFNVSPPIVAHHRGPKTSLSAADKRIIREANIADFQLWELFRRRRYLSFLRKGRHA